MNDLTVEFLESELGDSFYKELYHLNDSDNIVVRNESTGDLYVRKILKYYDPKVFDYLKAYPNIHIPKIHKFYEKDNLLVVYEEYVTGKTLDVYAQNATTKELVAVIDNVCEALEFLHNAEPTIIHRDIKPSNIMVTNDGVVKLIDYDAAKIVKPEAPKDTVLLGTVGYSAPEQYGFGSSDIRTDIYALGKLVEELFPNEKKYKDLVDKATHIDPEKRYPNVEKFRFALHHNMNFFNGFPGFRGESAFHKFRSAAGYIFALWIINGMTLQGDSQKGLIFYKLFSMIGLVASVDMLSGVSPVFNKLPLIRSNNFWIKSIGLVGYILLIFFLSFIFAGIFASFLPD